ncbi:hypothetical protein [Levilactobacillus acidifarinae]|uniref:Uncharacterized protein n=1 Tax=Levilactobacillus acidifarinae DSM 19394 = JCM 15949 TaxID=1423715 RepID=A0A0R1LKI7_9LACO|nr:hypothetical protein [Levilactobacillus acidifarinae]KRK94003.1 hypothetical protein FD25_GL001332 [Levilactobacillus acidifarinae DSM 19394]GEO68890.1 hypothetical protein LAC03_08000 [Levilactobacillus acidifarinae]
MEIGPISEWVAAIAEILAVVVALFLPYYTAYKAKKHQQRNLRVVLQKLVQAALADEPDSVKTLDIFLKISFLGNTDPANDNLLLVGNQALAILKDPAVAGPDKRDRITDLFSQVHLTLTD